MNNDIFHLTSFVAVLAAIVTLIVTHNADADYIGPLFVLLGTQFGYKIGGKDENKAS